MADAYTDAHFDCSVDAHTGFVTRSILAVPIRIGARVVAVLEALNHHGDGFTQRDLHLMEAIAVLVARLLLPQLLEAISAPEDSQDEDVEVKRLRTWLMLEYSTGSRHSSPAQSAHGSSSTSPRMSPKNAHRRLALAPSSAAPPASAANAGETAVTANGKATAADLCTSQGDKLVTQMRRARKLTGFRPSSLPNGLTMETCSSW